MLSQKQNNGAWRELHEMWVGFNDQIRRFREKYKSQMMAATANVTPSVSLVSGSPLLEGAYHIEANCQHTFQMLIMACFFEASFKCYGVDAAAAVAAASASKQANKPATDNDALGSDLFTPPRYQSQPLAITCIEKDMNSPVGDTDTESVAGVVVEPPTDTNNSTAAAAASALAPAIPDTASPLDKHIEQQKVMGFRGTRSNQERHDKSISESAQWLPEDAQVHQHPEDEPMLLTNSHLSRNTAFADNDAAHASRLELPSLSDLSGSVASTMLGQLEDHELEEYDQDGFAGLIQYCYEGDNQSFYFQEANKPLFKRSRKEKTFTAESKLLCGAPVNNDISSSNGNSNDSNNCPETGSGFRGEHFFVLKSHVPFGSPVQRTPSNDAKYAQSIKRKDLLDAINNFASNFGMPPISRRDPIWTSWFLGEYLRLSPEDRQLGRPLLVLDKRNDGTLRDAVARVYSKLFPTTTTTTSSTATAMNAVSATERSSSANSSTSSGVGKRKLCEQDVLLTRPCGPNRETPCASNLLQQTTKRGSVVTIRSSVPL